MPDKMPIYNMLGLKIYGGNLITALKLIERLIALPETRLIYTPNLYHLALISENPDFRQIYRSADYLLIDGASLVCIANFFYHIHLERINGTNLVSQLIEISSKKGYKIFFLGPKPEALQRLNLYLKRKYPELIFKTLNPGFKDNFNISDLQFICRNINSFSADLLMVGLGAPKQEILLYQIKNIVKVPVCIAVGGAIDYISGSKPRAPVWMQKAGLEWLFRILFEPRRIGIRFLRYDLPFLLKLIKNRKQLCLSQTHSTPSFYEKRHV